MTTDHHDATGPARLLVTCPDRPGIVSAVTTFLYTHGANITELDQHSTDPSDGTFFLRLEFYAPALDLSPEALKRAFADVVAERFEMHWRLTLGSDPRRVAVLVSGHDHCLMELLWLFARGELPGEIAMVIGNQPDAREKVESFGVPFHYLPVAEDGMAGVEARLAGLLDGRADLVVLARYMRVLSPGFVAAWERRMINIHHSFLPAFAGADPYRQAYERGVKIIGATAHYVTAELDGGPIIEQDTARVTHRYSVAELRRVGRELERTVLARAVRWHLEDRVIEHGDKTVVFR